MKSLKLERTKSKEVHNVSDNNYFGALLTAIMLGTTY